MDAAFQNFILIGQNGLILIGRAVLPVLFPFFVLTSLIINLFPTNRAWLVAGLSYFSGYPNGARLTKNLYQQSYLNQTTAQHLSILTSTPSPIFVIATVGTCFLGSTKIGIIIFLCSVGGAIVNGLLWRPRVQPMIRPIKQIKSAPPNFFTALNHALTTSTSAIVNVCGVVLFFYIAAQILQLPPFFAGLLEMTTGTAATTNPFLIEFFVSFGGLSIALQNLLFAESYGLHFTKYVLYKLTHAGIACGLFAICWFFL